MNVDCESQSELTCQQTFVLKNRSGRRNITGSGGAVILRIVTCFRNVSSFTSSSDNNLSETRLYRNQTDDLMQKTMKNFRTNKSELMKKTIVL